MVNCLMDNVVMSHLPYILSLSMLYLSTKKQTNVRGGVKCYHQKIERINVLARKKKK